MKVLYYLIVTIDIFTDNETILSVKPDWLKNRKTFKVTEDTGDEQIKKHRKYVGEVDALTLAKIWEDGWETCQTMGSISEMGFLPAVAWDYTGDYYNINIYVSPNPSLSPEEFKIYNNLSKEEKEIKNNIINNEISKILKLLDKEDFKSTSENEDGEEISNYPSEVSVSMEQCELILKQT